MIATKLSGGLGNNLFQYAAVRTLAEKKGYSFCHFPLRGRRYYFKRVMEHFSRLCGNGREKDPKQVVAADLAHYFTLGKYSCTGSFVRRLVWLLMPKARKTEFVAATRPLDGTVSFPMFDPGFFDVGDWTELSDGFQSDAYFADNRQSILRWYSLKPAYRSVLESIERRIGRPPEERCCIHVRRGDYLIMDKGLAWQGQGWALPLAYYKETVSRLPKDLLFIIVTDSPDYVREHFGFLDNMIVMSGNSEVIDMHIFTLCRYNIIANSTFSWWGAWLNEQKSKQVIAPKYHLGWAKQSWLPWAFERHPEDWVYIDTLKLIEPQEMTPP